MIINRHVGAKLTAISNQNGTMAIEQASPIKEHVFTEYQTTRLLHVKRAASTCAKPLSEVDAC